MPRGRSSLACITFTFWSCIYRSSFNELAAFGCRHHAALKLPSSALRHRSSVQWWPAVTRSHNVHIRQCKVCAFQTGRHIASACRSETCPLQPSFRLGGSQRPGLAESCSFSRHNCVHHTMPLYLARPCEPMISICGRILFHRRQYGRVRSAVSRHQK
jgi:hypothetical protein